MTILVGYASAHGSTRSIAERIGALLAERGFRADVRSMAEVEDTGAYEAFVLGSAVHDRMWLPEALVFLTRERDALADRPVWLFSVGMPAALRGPWRHFGAKEEGLVRDGLRSRVSAVDHRLFSGVFRREHTSLVGHLLFKALGCRYGDYRDWPRIDAWASTIMARPAFFERRRTSPTDLGEATQGPRSLVPGGGPPGKGALGSFGKDEGEGMSTQGVQLEVCGELSTSIDGDGGGGTARVTARGELDIASSAAFGIELARLIGERGPDVVVDVSGLTFCDARGLAALVAADELARRHGGAVTLTGPRPQMAKILRLTGLDRRFAPARAPLR